jgi:hypothetical protein
MVASSFSAAVLKCQVKLILRQNETYFATKIGGLDAGQKNPVGFEAGFYVTLCLKSTGILSAF